MKRLLLLTAALLFAAAASAQPLCCTEAGTELTYAQYDASGTRTGQTRTLVLSCEETDEGLKVYTTEEELDLSGTPSGNALSTSTLVRQNDMVLQLDEMLRGIDPSMLQGMTLGMGGDAYSIPFAMTPGEELPDIRLELKVSKEEKSLSFRINITDRKVLAREELETPAGHYPCIKLQEKFSFRFLFFSFSSRRVAWYTPGIGVVREEELTKKGKLESSSELIAIRHADASEEPAAADAGKATAGAK